LVRGFEVGTDFIKATHSMDTYWWPNECNAHIFDGLAKGGILTQETISRMHLCGAVISEKNKK
jgi:folate-binding Fe-S cluster repair protein YgfZ